MPNQADLSSKDYQSIMDQDQLSKLISQLEKADLFALDTETTSTNPMLAELVGFDTETTSINYMEAELVGLSFAVAEGEELPTLTYGDEITCAQCHVDRGLLKADLDADPKEEAAVSEASEGEG